MVVSLFSRTALRPSSISSSMSVGVLLVSINLRRCSKNLFLHSSLGGLLQVWRWDEVSDGSGQEGQASGYFGSYLWTLFPTGIMSLMCFMRVTLLFAWRRRAQRLHSKSMSLKVSWSQLNFVRNFSWSGSVVLASLSSSLSLLETVPEGRWSWAPLWGRSGAVL